MKYACPEAGTVEWIWNSRDGVTPFMRQPPGQEGPVRLPGVLAQHVDWHEDSFVPNFVPPIGMRVFVNAFDDPSGQLPDNVKIAVVDEAMRRGFLERAANWAYRPATAGSRL